MNRENDMHSPFRDPRTMYAVSELLKVLGPQIEDLDRASAALRKTLYEVRRLLRKE